MKDNQTIHHDGLKKSEHFRRVGLKRFSWKAFKTGSTDPYPGKILKEARWLPYLRTSPCVTRFLNGKRLKLNNEGPLENSYVKVNDSVLSLCLKLMALCFKALSQVRGWGIQCSQVLSRSYSTKWCTLTIGYQFFKDSFGLNLVLIPVPNNLTHSVD